jgi:hypothetical protein
MERAGSRTGLPSGYLRLASFRITRLGAGGFGDGNFSLHLNVVSAGPLPIIVAIHKPRRQPRTPRRERHAAGDFERAFGNVQRRVEGADCQSRVVRWQPSVKRCS